LLRNASCAQSDQSPTFHLCDVGVVSVEGVGAGHAEHVGHELGVGGGDEGDEDGEDAGTDEVPDQRQHSS